MSGYLFTSSERTKALQLRHSTKDKKVHVKLSVLLMLDAGFDQQTIAFSQGIHPDTVGNYKKRYGEKGFPACLEDDYVPFSGYLSEEQLTKLDTYLEQEVCLTARQAGDYVYAQFGLDYSDQGMTAILHRLGYVYKKVKQVPAKACAQDQQTFVQALEKLLSKPDTAVYFTDATHPTHNTAPYYGWIKKGEDKQVPANAGRARVNLHGAVSAKEPTQVVVQQDQTIDQDSTIALYSKLLEQSKAKKVVVICDNARYYHGSKVKAWLQQHPRLKQVFLPAYAPNLNLIERLWKFMKKKVIKSIYYPTYDKFRQAIDNFFHNINCYSEELKTLMTLKFQILTSPL